MKTGVRANLVAHNCLWVNRSNNKRQRRETERHRSPIRTLQVRKPQNLKENKKKNKSTGGYE